jgi:predicted ribosome quality control (RQC) complex YloA/Tae2 family protein
MPKEYHLLYTQSKLPIWVGKNAKMNDVMTFQLAHKKDLWFHVKDIPGPHVILHCEEHPVTSQDIQDAIQITQHYSKSKNPILYTQVLNVEKNKYSKAGQVIPLEGELHPSDG